MDTSFDNSYRKTDPTPLKFLVWIVKLFQHKKCKWLVQTCNIVLHLIALIFPFFDQNEHHYSTMDITELFIKFLDYSDFILLAITNFISIATVQRNIHMCDLIFILRNKFGNPKSNRKFSKFLSILYVTVIICIPFNIVILVWHYEASKVKYPIALSIEFWSFNLSVGLLSCVINYIKEIFEHANAFLVDRILANFYFTGKRIDSVIINDMKFITKHHNKCCELLDDCNNAFTPLMALVLFSINMLILWNVAMIIYLGSKQSTSVIKSQVYILVVHGIAALIAFVSLLNCLSVYTPRSLGCSAELD